MTSLHGAHSLQFALLEGFPHFNGNTNRDLLVSTAQTFHRMLYKFIERHPRLAQTLARSLVCVKLNDEFSTHGGSGSGE